MRPLVLAIVISSIGLFAAGTQAQQKALPTGGPQNRSYVPDLGDIMETTQLRHFKLYFAGHLKNWKLANYELSQIEKSFDQAAKFYPDIANVVLGSLSPRQASRRSRRLATRSGRKTAPPFREPSAGSPTHAIAATRRLVLALSLSECRLRRRSVMSRSPPTESERCSAMISGDPTEQGFSRHSLAKQ